MYYDVQQGKLQMSNLNTDRNRRECIFQISDNLVGDKQAILPEEKCAYETY
jgi:hypothetical protein